MTEKQVVTIDKVLQTFGGVLLLITSGFVGWVFIEVLNHRESLTKHTEQISNVRERMMMNEGYTQRSLDEIKQLIKEMSAKLDGKANVAR
jgi:hypothetical protein